MGRIKCSLLWAGLLWITLPGVASADLLLSAPPRENGDEAKKIYEPLARLLSEAAGERVVYEQPSDWAQYSTDMRGGKYDIVFDGPHFAAWRIKHLHHVPVAKLPGTLDFVVLVRWDDKRLNKLRDLVARPVCGLPSPNLGTTTIMAQFSNPVLQPEFNEIKGGFDDVIKAFEDGKCKAAVVRDNTYKKLPDEEKKQFKVIYKSQPYPNQTFTASNRVSAKAIEHMIAALTSKKDMQDAAKFFDEFSKKEKFMLPARMSEYQDMESLLEGVVWGW